MPLTELWGLEAFGLRSRRELAALGSRKVQVEVLWNTPPIKSLLRLSPRDRKRLVSVSYWDGIEKLLVGVPKAKLSKDRLTLTAQSLAGLPRVKNIGPLSLVSVRGIKRRPNLPVSPPQNFAVLVRLSEEVAGKRRGMQSIDERTVLLKAADAADAKRKAEKHFRRSCYTDPYVLPSGTPVRWRFERVVKVRPVVLDPLGDGVTTVWYSGGKRRMKPGAGWRP
jgi:hypothetical protein